MDRRHRNLDLDRRRTSRFNPVADVSSSRNERRQHQRSNNYAPYHPRSEARSSWTGRNEGNFSEFHSSNQSINERDIQRTAHSSNQSINERQTQQNDDHSTQRNRDGDHSRRSSRSRRSLLPDGWLDYSNVGKVIEGTRILCLKTPVDTSSLYRKNPGFREFGTEDFFREMNELNVKIGMLVDLTFTTKYYQGEVVAARRKLKYLKIAVPGQAIPPEQQYLQFRDEVDSFLANNPAEETVAVHCTHGVNRTGWFVCRYLMERQNMSFENARKIFATARGHDILREYLIKDLQERDCRALLASVRSTLPESTLQ